MKCNVNLDDEGYVLRIKTASDGEYELPDDLDLSCISCYRLVKGSFVADEEKMAQIRLADQAKNEIESLSKKLQETDYIIARTFEEVMALDNPLTFVSDTIKIIVNNSKKCQELLALRKSWRARIEELKEKLNA